MVILKTNQDLWVSVLWEFSRCTSVAISKLHHVPVLSMSLSCLNITISMHQLPHGKLVPTTSSLLEWCCLIGGSIHTLVLENYGVLSTTESGHQEMMTSNWNSEEQAKLMLFLNSELEILPSVS